MKLSSRRAVALTALTLMTLLAASTCWARPAVFADLDLAAARAAVKPDQYLIVDVGATWCAPCKIMDQTTWVDPGVVSWIKAHGLAIQIMSDLTPQPADELGVEMFPTLVIFKNGQEIDRAAGYLSPQAMLEWLEGIGQGKTMLTRLRERAGIDGPGPIDISARISYAQALLDHRQIDQGVSELIWLWRNVEPGTDLRMTPLPMLTQMVVESHPQNVGAFTKLRDELTAQTEAPTADPATLNRWALLTAVLGNDDLILAWHKKHAADASPEQLKEMLPWVELAMAFANRWAELGRLYPDPLAVVAERQAELKNDLDEQLKSAAPGQVEEIRRDVLQKFYQRLAFLYAGLLAADRDDAANTLADRTAKMDEPVIARVLCVQAALRAGHARPEHRQWLEEAGKSGVPQNVVIALKAQVDQALTGKP
ncbi:MAG: thioredoxin family protein [Phycisphaeraceae bacterium]|nr:thioredoxin family protein [Phycisphaeraceae bacterium]